jgi:ABC-type xylose transport system permease subunit
VNLLGGMLASRGMRLAARPGNGAAPSSSDYSYLSLNRNGPLTFLLYKSISHHFATMYTTSEFHSNPTTNQHAFHHRQRDWAGLFSLPSIPSYKQRPVQR